MVSYIHTLPKAAQSLPQIPLQDMTWLTKSCHVHAPKIEIGCQNPGKGVHHEIGQSAFGAVGVLGMAFDVLRSECDARHNGRVKSRSWEYAMCIGP